MERIGLLFDFDGVILDSEPLYEAFWEGIEKEYGFEVPNFVDTIRGTTMEFVLGKVLSFLSNDQKDGILESIRKFELEMNVKPIKGVMTFLESARSNGYLTALVTSSNKLKVDRALRLLGLSDYFDTIVTADSITKGKPDPMCYLLAAEKLGLSIDEVVVFEDSFNGIKSGLNAQMRVVGLATSNPRVSLEPLVEYIVEDFSDSDAIFKYINKRN